MYAQDSAVCAAECFGSGADRWGDRANPPKEDNIVDSWFEFTPNAGLYLHELTLYSLFQ